MDYLVVFLKKFEVADFSARVRNFINLSFNLSKIFLLSLYRRSFLATRYNYVEKQLNLQKYRLQMRK